MASDVVSLPKEEYELLVKCRHIVESEFEEHFSEEFISAVKESEEAYTKGEFIVVKNRRQRKKIFDSL